MTGIPERFFQLDDPVMQIKLQGDKFFGDFHPSHQLLRIERLLDIIV